MTRSILTGLAASVVVGILSGSGCAPTGIGDPCTPEQEYDPTFIGFDYHEVSTESKSFQCQTRLCLVNHFQGRVSCPYGQNADGSFRPPATPYQGCVANGKEITNPVTGVQPGCCTPGIPLPVTGQLLGGMPADQTLQQTVQGQCQERLAEQAVYCSCRCQNVNGATDDGAVYCNCPDGYSCTQLVSSITQMGALSNEGLTGGYCIKSGTEFKGACTACDPHSGRCGANRQGVP